VTTGTGGESRAAGALSRLRLAVALQEATRAGYTRADFRADLLAGTAVGLVALPLSMALAIASGVPPQHGLYTAIVAGAVIGLLGGSRTQVSGPTAAFVAVLVPIAARFGVGGLLLATALAGAILVLMGVARLGRLVEFIPYPVTAGFTAGIAVVIASLQLRDFLGLAGAPSSPHFFARVATIVAALPATRPAELGVGMLTLTILLVWPRLSHKVPSPLVGLGAAAVVGVLLSRIAPASEVATIASRFSYVSNGVEHAGIPQSAPLPLVPWTLPGPDGRPLGVSIELLRQLIGPALAIALLGAIESLLSAVIADGMTGTRHDPDAELIAQGAGNLIAPFFGGFAATGALARTATNIRAGARSPVAAAIHAAFVLAAILVLAPALGHLPMAALAALLLVVAWNMAEVKHIVRVLRVAPRSDAIVLVTCFLLTIVFDMVVAVSVGVVLAALLFMRRMADISGARLVGETHPELREPLPSGAVCYEVAGPLFFGAAQKAMSALHAVAGNARAVIIDMSAVPVMDATGLVNLESALDRLLEHGTLVVFAGVNRQPLRVFARGGIVAEAGRVAFTATLHDAAQLARLHLDVPTPEPPPAA